MKWSDDWGATTTWFGFGMLVASTLVLMQQFITPEIWLIANGIGGVPIGVKGAAKVIKKNGATAAPPPTS